MAADWDGRFLRLAAVIGQWSKDPSTKVGAIIVKPETHAIISTGFNGFPPGHLDDPELYADRAYKYRYVVHAEDNALRFLDYRAKGCCLYTSFPTCPNCFRLAVQGGIDRIVQPSLNIDGRTQEWIAEWRATLEQTAELARTHKVELISLVSGFTTVGFESV